MHLASFDAALRFINEQHRGPPATAVHGLDGHRQSGAGALKVQRHIGIHAGVKLVAGVVVRSISTCSVRVARSSSPVVRTTLPVSCWPVDSTRICARVADVHVAGKSFGNRNTKAQDVGLRQLDHGLRASLDVPACTSAPVSE